VVTESKKYTDHRGSGSVPSGSLEFGEPSIVSFMPRCRASTKPTCIVDWNRGITVLRRKEVPRYSE
jgi:hypothetical protein